MDRLSRLESMQTQILQRIAKLEMSLLPQEKGDGGDLCSGDGGETMEARLSGILRSRGVTGFCFRRVPGDYYDRSLEDRRDILGAISIDHLCKSIVMVNTQAPANVTDCSNHNNSKYYIVIVQYTARLNAENIKNYLYSLNNGKIPKKKFNMRLAPENESLKLTGYEHNGVTCIGMKTIPVILYEAIVKLKSNFFWLGGGEVDLKLGMELVNFCRLSDHLLFVAVHDYLRKRIGIWIL